MNLEEMQDALRLELNDPEGLQIDNCEYPGSWMGKTNVTLAYSSTIFVEGAFSVKAIPADAFTTGVMIYHNITMIDLSQYSRIVFWVRSSIDAVTAGYLELILCKAANGDSIVENLDIPAILNKDTWYRFAVDLADPSLCTNIVCIGLNATADIGTCSIYLDDIRAEKSVVWTDDELTRCIEHAVSDLSRFIPNDAVEEVTVVIGVDDEEFTPDLDAWVTLDNAPIDPKSETVEVGDVVYVRDTDYTMDYVHGKIMCLSTGSMLEVTSLISYNKFQIVVDISTLEYTKLRMIEYPAGNIPLDLAGFWIHGDKLYIQYVPDVSGGRGSMTALTEDEHVIIYYETVHTAPGASDGSYQPYLDAVVMLGAKAYANFMKANKYLSSSADALEGCATLIDAGDAYLNAVTVGLNTVVEYRNYATTKINEANAYQGLYDRCIDVAKNQYAEFIKILSDKAQVKEQMSASAQRQPR